MGEVGLRAGARDVADVGAVTGGELVVGSDLVVVTVNAGLRFVPALQG